MRTFTPLFLHITVNYRVCLKIYLLSAGEFYVNELAIDGYRCICYKILTSEFVGIYVLFWGLYECSARSREEAYANGSVGE